MASRTKSNGATSDTSSTRAAVGEERTETRSQASALPLRVLLIEDQPADAQLVNDLLGESEDVRFEVAHVTRLDSAVDRMRDEDFDLVLLDLSLPDGYGSFTIEFAAKFAKQLPVVILTGIEDESLARTAIQVGAADYICKSMLGEVHLARTIECAVERQRRLSRLAGLAPDRGLPGVNDSLYDPVTGLMSEALFKDRLEHTLACSERNQSSFTLLALRLNELVEIQSDHAVGELMSSAASCLSRRVRKSDSLARISRDSFGLVINGLSEFAAVNSAVGSFVMSLSSVSLPENALFAAEDLSTSVGVSIHPDNGNDTATLMSRAMQFGFATARIGASSNPPVASA